jgi:type IV pilus assembly protein PilX
VLCHNAEQGVVLVVALVFLALLTLLAVAASSGSLLQQYMVGATRNAQLATMSADSALRGAEWQLWSYAHQVNGSLVCNAGSINATTGCIVYDPASTPYAANGDVVQFRTHNNKWFSNIGVVYMGGAGKGYTDPSGQTLKTARIAKNPHYIIECMGPVKPPGTGAEHESGASNSGGCGGVPPGVIKPCIYRISARATGGSKNIVRLAESTFDSICPT